MNKMKEMIEILAWVALVMFVVVVGVCQFLNADEKHATVTISAGGEVEFMESVNGTTSIHSGEEIALRNVCKVTMAEGESIQLGFYCPACRNEQQEIIDYPCLKIVHCDCPEKGDENGEAKEYFALKVQVQ